MEIAPGIVIDESELSEEFVRSTGPGGQNVNKVATAVQLRFDALHSPSLPEDVRRRLMHLAGSHMTTDGVLVITARRSRSQSRNREEARARLADLLRRAAHKPRARRPTAPTTASRRRRLEQKRLRSATKGLRQTPGRGED